MKRNNVKAYVIVCVCVCVFVFVCVCESVSACLSVSGVCMYVTLIIMCKIIPSVNYILNAV